MAKKIYGLEFMYSNKDGDIKEYSIDNIDIEKKDELVQKTCQELMCKQEAVNIVVKETCIYKAL